MTAATSADLVADFRSQLRDLLSDEEVCEELLRALDVVIAAVRSEAGPGVSGLKPTEEWLSTPYPKAPTTREIRLRWQSHSGGFFETVAYLSGACHGQFGYGHSVEESFASLMNKLSRIEGGG